ncbi:hypothetical protein EVAR_100370_1 [Eumeta japonica]|uniref:Uncharacterized protein n=1 Tax=Eumeta variegata TaxID=151549 RepID=A0A4C1TNX3_EUMVA|nr:hypothetical protein EVAR_100370_1 [Eumeta japonica]
MFRASENRLSIPDVVIAPDQSGDLRSKSLSEIPVVLCCEEQVKPLISDIFTALELAVPTAAFRNLQLALHQCESVYAISASVCEMSLKDRCSNSDVRERCGTKEDVVAKIEKVHCSGMAIWKV